jgi:uncharacterized protein (TIGR02466 family)
MNRDELIPLFSKPVFKSELTTIDIDLSSITWHRNYQNYISSNQDVLSLDIFNKLSTEICEKVAEYFYGIMQTSQQTEIYITESWLNKTEKGQSHHRHWHPNSVISGVVYLAGDPESGHLRFITSQYNTLEFEIAETNIYNAKSWASPGIPGSIILFPSNLEHLVDEYQGDIPRITLSFNTFVKGKINNLPLTRLSV